MNGFKFLLIKIEKKHDVEVEWTFSCVLEILVKTVAMERLKE